MAHNRLGFSLTRAGCAILTLVAAAAYSAISIYRHDHFGSTVDLAIQDQTVWGYSHLQVIPNTVLGVPNLLGDHFHPILMAMAPLYWISSTPETLLVAQGVVLALGGVPIFIWGSQRLGEWAGLAFQAAYLMSWGVLAGVLFDFHPTAFAVPAIAAALYAAIERRNRLLIAMVAVAMLTREDIALTLIALGFYIALVQRRVILGLGLSVINGAWFALLLGWVMPALAGGPYRHWTYDALGADPQASVIFVLLHPLNSIELLFSPFEKVRVWLGMLGNWVFLPLLSPIAIVAIPTFLARFWSSDPNLWSFHFQYSMIAVPVLAFAAIDFVVRVKRMSSDRIGSLVGKVVPATVFAISVLLTIAINPLDELASYVSAATAADIQSCLDVIPRDASVAASQELLPHLTQRSLVYPIPTNADVDDIAIDIASDGNDEDELRTLVTDSLNDGYGVACTKDLAMVLAKGAPDQALTPQLDRWLADDCNGRACLSSG